MPLSELKKRGFVRLELRRRWFYFIPVISRSPAFGLWSIKDTEKIRTDGEASTARHKTLEMSGASLTADDKQYGIKTVPWLSPEEILKGPSTFMSKEVSILISCETSDQNKSRTIQQSHPVDLNRNKAERR